MRELRLLPSALLTWLVVLSIIMTRQWWIAVLLIALGVMAAGVLKHTGQAVTTGAVTATAGIVAWMRIRWVENFRFPDTVTGRVESLKKLEDGLVILRLRVEGYPAAVPVFLRSDQEVERSALVSVSGRVSDNDRPGVGDTVISAGEVVVENEASGYAAWVNHVRDHFALAAQRWVGESSQGLVPGMVLGDTRMQDAWEQQIYIDTGLSHLSAVSGANVAIVTTSVIVLLSLITVGPRIQIAAAAIALVVFVSLVGLEPSVLRASVTGMVGLLAVINSRRMEPIHGLCLAVIGLLIWDSDLAVQFSFILSVVATAGIVMLFPLLYKALAPTKLPDTVIRALAVAIAADVVTMPVIAVMAGRVSMVSVLANVLVAPAVAPVTVVGLLAVILTLLPGPLEAIALKIVEPCTWWIHHVGKWCHSLPNATLETGEGWLGPVWIVTACMWMVMAIHYGLARVIVAGFLVALAGGWYQNRLPEVVDPSEMDYAVVDKLSGVGSVPPGTALIIVVDPDGQPATLPTVTADGIPVLFPHRDGEVTLHVDGSQHAADGRF